ncbi:MAG: hypothetical protein NC340_06955 [Ruminococcus flavefaciens]|nr:hypothetical protein [Ruminococcus flavefaciens]MCM1230406.1 hypothetical protein [Ruminococcus flavefaciens]
MNILQKFIKRFFGQTKSQEKNSNTRDLNVSIELPIYEEFTDDRNYKFEIFKKKNYYNVVVLKKITDDYYASADYFTHLVDTLEKAIEIGKESLRCFEY